MTIHCEVMTANLLFNSNPPSEDGTQDNINIAQQEKRRPVELMEIGEGDYGEASAESQVNHPLTVSNG